MSIDVAIPVQVGLARVHTRVRSIRASEVAVLLGVKPEEVVRLADARGLEEVGVDGVAAYDPEVTAAIVDEQVNSGAAEPLAMAVLRALLVGDLNADDLTGAGKPESLIELIRLALRRNETARVGAASSVARDFARQSIETKAWSR